MTFDIFIKTPEAESILESLLIEFGYTQDDGDKLIFAFTKVGENFEEYKKAVELMKLRQSLVYKRADIEAQINEIDNGEYNPE